MTEKERPAASAAGQGQLGEGSAYPHYTTTTRDGNPQIGGDAESSYLKAALALQDRGLAAIPLRGKTPIHRGWQRRRLEPDELRRAFAAPGVTGVGVVCGALSGNLVILDFDGDGWEDAYEHFRHSWPELEDTTVVITGSGRRHIWLLCPDLPAGFTSRRFQRGDAVIELRGNRCQCAVPPSKHPSGGRYQWEAIEAKLCEVKFSDLIQWLSDWGGVAPEGTEAGGGGRGAARRLPEAIAEGERNTTLTSLAGSMRRRGMSEEAIHAALRVINQERCRPPLDDAELVAIARSIARYEPAAAGGGGLQAAAGDEGGIRRIDAGIANLAHITQMAWEALVAANEPPALFMHGTVPTRLELANSVAVLVELTPERLRHELARAAYWYTRRKADGLWGEQDAKPPLDVVRDMLATPAHQVPLPAADRVVRSPVFAPDGALLSTPGYHAAGRVIVAFPPDLEPPAVSKNPTRQEMAEAVGVIDDLLQDFPFAERGADRAHAFALLLVPLVRDLIEGPTPLHLIESPAPGSGKGLLASVLLTAALGDHISMMATGGNDEEWRKRLTTALMVGQSAYVMDNVTTLKAGPLSCVLTARFWTDRVLGASEQVSLPVRCAWVATGNNPTLSTEIARRTVRIRLDPKIDQPWRRGAAAFAHPELLTYARQTRGRVLAAALTLVQGWLAAGRPPADLPAMGSYEDWSRVLGGILAHAGIPGFLTNLDALYERADTEGAVWRRFVAAWWDAHGGSPVGVAELYPLAESLEDFPLGDGLERSQKTRLGRGLKDREDMVLGGYRIESAGTHDRRALYRLHKVGAAAPATPASDTAATVHPSPAPAGDDGDAAQALEVLQARGKAGYSDVAQQLHWPPDRAYAALDELVREGKAKRLSAREYVPTLSEGR